MTRKNRRTGSFDVPFGILPVDQVLKDVVGRTAFDLFGDAFDSSPGESAIPRFSLATRSKASYPRMDVYVDPDTCVNCSDDGDVIIEAAVPGRSKDSIDIVVEGSHIVISGESQVGDDYNDNDFFVREVMRSSFVRAVGPFHDDRFDIDNISASMNNGVLRVYVPRKEQSVPENVSRMVQIE